MLFKQLKHQLIPLNISAGEHYIVTAVRNLFSLHRFSAN